MNKIKYFRHFRLMLQCCLVSSALSQSVIAAEPAQEATNSTQHQTTMIVLDGSNSMWGQINEVNKIVTARDSLRTLIENAESDIDFGLIVYGNKRRKDGCSDINVVMSPKKYDKVSLLKEVYRVKPLGRSPIAAALEKAARQLPKEGGQILLVSDGEESCQGDPCAIAKKLTQKYNNLRIDVIGFRENKEAQLECIAENGKGSFVFARDTERLKTLIAGVQGGLQTEPATEITAEQTIDTTAPPGTLVMTIQATGQSSDTDTTPLQANYSIYTPAGEHIATFTARQQVTEYLRPGTYRIKAIWQNLELEDKITIQANKTLEHTFPIGPIGKVKLNALDSKNQPIPTTYLVYTKEGRFVTKAILRENLDILLPVGEFRIKATVNDQERDLEVKVSPNVETTHTFEFADK